MVTAMKILFTGLLTFSCISVRAQSSYFYPPLMSDSAIRAHGISEVNIMLTKARKKSAYHYRRVLYYDEYGHNVFQASIYDTLKQNRIWHATTVLYTGTGNRSSMSVYLEGRDAGSRITDHNAEGRYTANRFYGRRGNLTRSTEYTYEDSMLVKMSMYNRRHRLQSYYVYTCQNRKTLSSALYDRKGRLKRYWDYTCDDAGASFSKSPDTLKICTVKSYRADGSVVTTTHSFDFSGAPVRHISITDSMNRLIQYVYVYGLNEVTGYRHDYSYTGSRLSGEYILYADKKGKRLFASRKKYDLNGRLETQNDSDFRSPKPKMESFAFTYNEKGLLSSKTGTCNGKFCSSEYYTYRFRRKD